MKTSNKKSNPVNPSSETINNLIDQMQITDYSVTDNKYVILPSHPHVTYLEEKINELEGGSNTLILESLTVARYLLFKSLLRPGDNVVSFNSWSLYFNDEPKYRNSGISIRLSVDGRIETLLELIDDRTKIIYLETVSDELIGIPDFRKIAAIAREKNIPLVVDNTTGGPGYLTSPFRYGANIVLLDTTPWLLHNRSYAGAAIIENGNYNWINKKFDHIANDENSKKSLPNKSSLQNEKFYFSILENIRQSSHVKNMDLTIAPNWHFDIENIDYVLFRQSENAALLSAWLKKQEYIKYINYQGFSEKENSVIASKIFKSGYGNTFSFKLKADFSSHENYIKKIKELDIPPYLFRIYYDSIVSSIIVSTGHGDFEEIKRFFQSAFEKTGRPKELTLNIESNV